MTRTEILCRAFGWHGGTIHQVASATGCTMEEILAHQPNDCGPSTIYNFGKIVGQVCWVIGTKHAQEAYRHHAGSPDFWVGVANGFKHRAGLKVDRADVNSNCPCPTCYHKRKALA